MQPSHCGNTVATISLHFLVHRDVGDPSQLYNSSPPARGNTLILAQGPSSLEGVKYVVARTNIHLIP